MSKVLLDTNVLSELVRAQPNPKVKAFVRTQTDPLISTLTVHELFFGAERAADPARRAKLFAWVTSIQSQFAGRMIDIDLAVAERAGQMRANAAAQGITCEAMDALIAACAAMRGAAVATRNVKDFAPLGVVVIDPWTA